VSSKPGAGQVRGHGNVPRTRTERNCRKRATFFRFLRAAPPPVFPLRGAIRGGRAGGVDAHMRELVLISIFACFGLALAWAHEADFLRFVFLQRRLLASSKQLDDLCEPTPQTSPPQRRPVFPLRNAATKNAQATSALL
jgi:hypothetical protein